MQRSSGPFTFFLIAFFITVSLAAILFATGVFHVSHREGPPVKYGFLGKDGKLALPIEWDSVSDFHNGMATVYNKGKALVIDQSGNIINVQPFHYRVDSIPVTHIKISTVEKGCRDCDKLYTPVGAASDGKALYRILRKKTIKGNECTCDFAYFFVTQHGPVEKARLYEEALPYHDSLAAVRREIGKVWKSRWYERNWCFIDLHGNNITSPCYCDVHSFSEGLAAVAIKMVPHSR